MNLYKQDSLSQHFLKDLIKRTNIIFILCIISTCCYNPCYKLQQVFLQFITGVLKLLQHTFWYDHTLQRQGMNSSQNLCTQMDIPFPAEMKIKINNFISFFVQLLKRRNLTPVNKFSCFIEATRKQNMIFSFFTVLKFKFCQFGQGCNICNF